MVRQGCEVLAIGVGNVNKAYTELTAGTYNDEGLDPTAAPTLFMGSDRQVYRTIKRVGKPYCSWEEIADGSVGTPIVAVFATPSNPAKNNDMDYATPILRRPGSRVIFASKAALADKAKFDELMALTGNDLTRIGPSASVGGANPVLEILSANAGPYANKPGSLESITFGPNGTWNFVLQMIASGSRFDDAVREAKTLGYAEPGDAGPVETMMGEVDDSTLKSAIAINVGRLCAESVDYTALSSVVTEEQIEHVLNNGGRYQNVIMIVRQGMEEWLFNGDERLVGGARHDLSGNLTLVKGFALAGDSQAPEFVRRSGTTEPGPTSKIRVVRNHTSSSGAQSHLVTVSELPGAGGMPTALSMYKDLKRMRRGLSPADVA